MKNDEHEVFWFVLTVIVFVGYHQLYFYLGG